MLEMNRLLFVAEISSQSVNWIYREFFSVFKLPELNSALAAHLQNQVIDTICQ